MRDSFCGWWRNRLTTQKNDRRWRTKEHPDHLTVDRSYTICNNRPGHCPSLPWVLCLPLVGLKLKKYCKSLLCFLMTQSDLHRISLSVPRRNQIWWGPTAHWRKASPPHQHHPLLLTLTLDHAQSVFYRTRVRSLATLVTNSLPN